MENRKLENEIDIFFNNVLMMSVVKQTCRRGIAMVMMACLSGREGLSSVDFRA